MPGSVRHTTRRSAGLTNSAFRVRGLTALAVGAGLAFAAGTTPLNASTITNADRTTHQLRITEGTDVRVVSLAAAALLEDVCKARCTIRLNGDPQADYVLEGNERVSIEDGLVYYDGPVGGEDDATERQPAPRLR
ncbi:MAG: hypothetical protein AAFQ45_15555 [Pseudomonadota bacterium]